MIAAVQLKCPLPSSLSLLSIPFLPLFFLSVHLSVTGFSASRLQRAADRSCKSFLRVQSLFFLSAAAAAGPILGPSIGNLIWTPSTELCHVFYCHVVQFVELGLHGGSAWLRPAAGNACTKSGLNSPLTVCHNNGGEGGNCNSIESCVLAYKHTLFPCEGLHSPATITVYKVYNLGCHISFCLEFCYL